jgi:hypothetical protein
METPVEFRPERFSRQGEAMAWGLTILAGVGWAVFTARGIPLPFLYRIISAVLLITALSLTLTNWVDRSTILHLDDEGVRFENGLRHVEMHWPEIMRVQVIPMNLGRLVRVISQKTYFTFRTLGEVTMRGQTRGRVGFAQGDQILATILERSGLQSNEPVHAGPRPSDGYYYSRE